MDENLEVGAQPERNEDGIRRLEDAVVFLENASNAESLEKISSGFPVRLSELVNSLDAIAGRAEAERLLSVGMHPIFIYFFCLI